MKYIKVKQLQKMLSKQDPEAEIFIGLELPKAVKKFVPYIGLYGKKPRFEDPYTDIDGSKYVSLFMDLEIERG